MCSTLVFEPFREACSRSSRALPGKFGEGDNFLLDSDEEEGSRLDRPNRF